MKKLIALEEVGMFLVAIIGFAQLHFKWWVFPALLLLPDISMIGYAVDPKVGAILYNIVHHKLVAILVFLTGFYTQSSNCQLVGIMLFAHSCLDRIFGYGLKYPDAFTNTHLGIIGKNK